MPFALQVLQATTPSLCLKPAGLPSSYSWCRALDVYALLPTSSSTAATSGFWYEPAGTAAAPRASSQFLTFAPQAADSDSSLGAGSGTSFQHAEVAAAAAAAAAVVGSLVLAVGASPKPWPAGVVVQDAGSTSISHGGSIYSRSRATAGAGSSASSMLWQLVVEPPALLINQLPVAVEVSVVAGKGEVRGLAALVDSRQQLPLYGCEAAYYSKLRVQVAGFQSSSWIPLNAAFSNSSARAAAARHLSDPGTVPRHSSTGGAVDASEAAPTGSAAPRHSDAGGALQPAGGADGASAAVPDALQLLDQRQVVLAGLQAHQPPQVLQLRTCRNKLTGCLTLTVSCSLWIFNCLGSQIAIRQPGSAATPAESMSAAGPGAAAAPGLAPFATNLAGISTSSSQVMWLPPYPWMSIAQGSGSSSDLVGLGAAAAGASSHGPPSMASAWAAARRSDASGGGSSRSALQRSRSTPSLLASTAGLEFLAVNPAREHAAGAAPSSAARATGLSTYQRRASRGEQHSQGVASTQAMQSVTFGTSPFAAAAGVASLLTSSGATADSGGALPPAWPQEQHEQQPQLSVRRSFSASAQLMGPNNAGELPVALADAAQGTTQQGAGTAGWHQQDTGAGEAGDAGLSRSGRTRRHSSGLHMLASGRLPQQLLPELPDSSAGMPAGCSSFDLLSPTHQQRLLQQMHFQQAAVAATAAAASGGAQLAQSASAIDLAPADGCQAVVLPLMKPDMSGWLPLLAGGDLHQLNAAAAAFAGPVSTAEVVMATPPADSALTAAAASQAAMQQRVAAAAAAADQLLADMPRGQHHVLSAQQQTDQVLRRLGSPPSSVSQFALSQADGRADGLQLGRAPSFGGNSHYGQHGQQYGQQHSHYSVSAGGAYVPSGPGLAGLALQGHPGAAPSSFQPAHAPQGMMRRPSGSWSGAGFADLAAAAAAVSHVAPSSSDVGYRGLHGSVGGGLSAAPPGYAASYRSTAVVDAASSTSSAAVAAAPVMCGWPVHMLESRSSTAAAGRLSTVGPAVSAAASSACGFIELQLCAAPAAIAAAMMGRGVQQVPAQWSLPARVPLLGPQSNQGPCSIMKLPLSVPASAAAAAGQAAGLTGASGSALGGAGTGKALAGEATPAVSRRRSSTRGRAAGAAAQHEQGACFVSVHTAAVPGGGGAWAVHLLPTYVLVNSLATEVQLRQCDSELVLQTVAPGGHCCVLWPNAALPLKLQFRVDEPGWSWSGAASVDAPGEFLVK